MKIYTKSGDEGETGLLFGGRVPKNHPRCEAYGAIDEAVSAMGLARALCGDIRVVEVLLRVQREMFTVGAELATDREQYHHLQQKYSVVTAEMVDDIEKLIDELQAEMEFPRAFIVPGASPGSGALDLARSLMRRAERRVVDLQRDGLLVSGEVLRYVNRVSDLLFVLARYEDRGTPFELAAGERA